MRQKVMIIEWTEGLLKDPIGSQKWGIHVKKLGFLKLYNFTKFQFAISAFLIFLTHKSELAASNHFLPLTATTVVVFGLPHFLRLSDNQHYTLSLSIQL